MHVLGVSYRRPAKPGQIRSKRYAWPPSSPAESDVLSEHAGQVWTSTQFRTVISLPRERIGRE
jgi:hypothetical protein